MGGGFGLVEEGRLKLLAIASAQRSKLLPDVPALGELYPGLDVPVWLGFAFAAGTPAPLVQKLEEATLGALDDPATRPAFAQISVDLDPVMGSREDVGRRLPRRGSERLIPRHRHRQSRCETRDL